MTTYNYAIYGGIKYHNAAAVSRSDIGFHFPHSCISAHTPEQYIPLDPAFEALTARKFDPTDARRRVRLYMSLSAHALFRLSGLAEALARPPRIPGYWVWRISKRGSYGLRSWLRWTSLYTRPLAPIKYCSIWYARVM